LFGSAAIVFTEQCEEAVAEQPRFDVNIIDKDNDGAEDADDAEILDEFVFVPEGMKHSRRGAVSEAAAEPADSPFNPHQRQSYQKQGHKIRYHKCPASIFCCLDRKS